MSLRLFGGGIVTETNVLSGHADRDPRSGPLNRRLSLIFHTVPRNSEANALLPWPALEPPWTHGR